MKKFLSIVAVLALVFALAVPAFAAEPSVTYDVAAKTEDKDIVVEPGTKNEAAAAAVEDAVAKIEGAAVAEVMEVINTDPEYNGKDPVTVTLVRDDDNEVLAVLLWDNGKWEEQKFTQNGKEITVEFEHLSPVTLVVSDKPVKAAADTKKDETKTSTGAGTGAGGKKSPQTGYNVALLSVAAVAMALCAGYCFTRKVTE